MQANTNTVSCDVCPDPLGSDINTGLCLFYVFFNHISVFLNLTPSDVTMAANFSISSDSDSEPSEEVEEGEHSQSPAEEGQQVSQRHALTLPELRMAGRKPERKDPTCQRMFECQKGSV